MAEPVTDTKGGASGALPPARPSSAGPIRRIGRYDLHEELASGGMATVYLGRLVGATGFSRPVAIKRLHDNLATDPKFVSMLLDEARLAARVRHPNVVSTLDVVEEEREVVVVMEYVHGESLALLRKITSERGERIPPKIAATIVAGALHGLHAAHEAVDEQGEPLHIVHRDVSPQNILVGVDGIPRVLDFGIAKAAGRMQTTQDGKLKGKFGYMAPEQLKAAEITARADVYAAAVVLWESLTGQRLHPEEADAATILTKALFEEVTPPSKLVSDLPSGADDVVMRGLAKEPDQRYATALEMADAVEHVFGVASRVEVANYVLEVAKDALQQKSEALAFVERADTDAGQKQRREVVARVAAGVDSPRDKRLSLAWIVALVAVAGAGVLVYQKIRPAPATTDSPPSKTPTTTSAPPSAEPGASGVATGSPTAPATDPAIPTPASATSAPVPPVSVATAGKAPPITNKTNNGRKQPPRKTDAKGAEHAETTAPTTAATPTTPAATETEDAGRDLIPKFRK